MEDKKRIELQIRHAQKMEALGTLAGGVSHDFNNILSAILGYTELLQLECKAGTKEHEYLEGFYNAGNRAKDLVKQILTFSRQAGQEYKPVRVDIIIKEVLKFIRASLPSTIAIKQTLNPDALVMGDPTQLHQVIMNLCTNAGYAMMDKGGVLELELKKRAGLAYAFLKNG